MLPAALCFPPHPLGSRCREPRRGTPEGRGNAQEGAQGTRELHVILQMPPALRDRRFQAATEIPAGSPHPPRASCEVFPGERRPFPAGTPDQSGPRALSRCSAERSCRGGHKGNKGSRVPSECINYFQWLPPANPLPLLPSFPGPGVWGAGQPRGGRAGPGSECWGGAGGGVNLQ